MEISDIIEDIRQKRRGYLISYTNSVGLYSETLNSIVKIKFAQNISSDSNCHSILIENSNQLNEILISLNFHNADKILAHFHKKYSEVAPQINKYLNISYFNLDNFQFGC
tara:strand:- start:368 stop:697 length:330 start_codon:yes stop_codon:yes gene_type:complete